MYIIRSCSPRLLGRMAFDKVGSQEILRIDRTRYIRYEKGVSDLSYYSIHRATHYLYRNQYTISSIAGYTSINLDEYL